MPIGDKRHIERKRNIPRLEREVYALRKFTLPGDCFATRAKTVKEVCHRERKRGDPLEKVRDIYSPYFTPRVDSPDETGEVARVSVPKGGRAVEPAAVAMLPRNDN